MTISCLLTDWREEAYALDRCWDYTVDVRIQHEKYFGMNYPWWYGVGQLQQESGCRSSVTAFDLGKGVAQFMPATEKEVEKYLGELDMYNPEHAIKAQAFYMARLHRSNPTGSLWLTYQAYNGGWKYLKIEYQRAGYVPCWALMRMTCARKVLRTKKFVLDFCEVNYDYSMKVYSYGQFYKRGRDTERYW
jgi:hypothetical protein